MKLLTFEYQGEELVGFEKEGFVVPVAAQNMISLISDGAAMANMRQAYEMHPAGEGISLSDITFLPPVRRPGKVIALGRNYAAHAAEGGAKVPDYPMLFHKTHTSLTGEGAVVAMPSVTQAVDYEAEMAVIIGKTCKNVSEADAMGCVAGYTVANDLSARDLQRRTSQFSSGKMLDEFCPLGPYFVTADEIEDVQNLDIQLWLNGELMQSSNTKMMIFSVAFTIAYISRICTLEVGDVILTGTPEGVGYARTPPVYLQPGDEVIVAVENVGRLTNTMAAGE